MRRPLVWFSACFLAALALSLLTEGSFGLLPAAFAVLLFFVLQPGPLADSKWLPIIAGLAFLAALGAAEAYRTRVARWETLAGQTAYYTGWVREEDPYLPGRGKVQGTLQLEDGGEATGAVLLDIRGVGEALTPGGWVSGQLLISEVRRNGDAPGGVSLYCIALGEAEDVPAPPGFHPAAQLAAFRWTMSQQVWTRSQDQPTAVVLAMVLSRQDLLPQAVLDRMSRAGLRHLLVVSGLHLSMAVGWILAAFRQLWPGKQTESREAGRGGLGERAGGPGSQNGAPGERAGALLAWAVVWLMAGLAGFSVSVVRAALMSSLWLTGLLVRRRADSLTSLALAALLLAAVSPPVILQTGYQLTFLATLGVLLGSRPLAESLFRLWEGRFHRMGPLARWALEGLSVSLCAQLGTLPVLAAVYGQFSVWGLFTILPAMPLTAGIILLGGVGCILLSSWVDAAVPRLLLGLARLLGRGVLALAELVGRLPGGTVPVLLPYQLVLCLLLPAAVFAYLRRLRRMDPRRARLLRRGMVLAAVLVLVYHVVYYHNAVLVSANGDTGAVVISAPGGTLVLAQGEDDYDHRMVSSQLLRCGADGPLTLVCPWDSSANGILWWRTALAPVLTLAPEEETQLLGSGEYLPLAEKPVEVLPDIFVSHPAPEITCVEVSGRKVLKSWAGYGIISDKPFTGDLLIDMDGRMYPLSPELRPGRMLTGDTNLLLPAW